MAKKRVRSVERTPSRAELKALERRASSAGAVVGSPEVPAATPPAVPVGTLSGRRGVLPPRVSRLSVAVPTLSREEELGYIRADLIRMVILGLAMVALIVLLAWLVPLVVG